MNRLFRTCLISTGGTIEKTYDELAGVMANRVSVLDVMLASLELRGSVIERCSLMNKDSLEMTPSDHDLIAVTVADALRRADGVVVVHGTDRLARTGHAIYERLARSGEGDERHRGAVVLTGAMRPFELRRTDAVQNLTEALVAVQILPPGVYVAMHNQVLSFPGVEKDPVQGTFVRTAR